MQILMAWLTANQTMILGFGWAISEALSMIPAIKANGVFQLIFGWLKSNKDAQV